LKKAGKKLEQKLDKSKIACALRKFAGFDRIGSCIKLHQNKDMHERGSIEQTTVSYKRLSL